MLPALLPNPASSWVALEAQGSVSWEKGDSARKKRKTQRWDSDGGSHSMELGDVQNTANNVELVGERKS